MSDRRKRIVVTIDQGRCMRVRSCERIAPGSFVVDGQIVEAVNEPKDDLELIVEAAAACPNFAITVEVDGNMVFDPEVGDPS